MCFGNTATTTTDTTGKTSSTGSSNSNSASTSTTTPSTWVTSAAQGNLDFVNNLQNAGFQGYGGQYVANFSPQQQQSFGGGNNLFNTTQGYVPASNALIFGAGASSAPTVTSSTIASRMSPYMNQYVMQALQPQLAAQDQQFAAQNKSFDSAATGAGAFGDTSWGLGRGNLTTQQDISRTGLIGNAYNAAFNTAIGAGAQDVSNDVNAQTTNANLAQGQKQMAMTSGQQLFNNATGATNLENTLGKEQTAASQADLNARYNQYLLSLQYPFQTAELMNKTISTAKDASPTTTTAAADTTADTTASTDSTSTSTKKSPDNTGWGIVGSILGAGTKAVLAADGGVAKKGKLHIVGERGPEIFVPLPNKKEKKRVRAGKPRALADGAMGGGAASVIGAGGPQLFVPQKDGVVIPNETLRAAVGAGATASPAVASAPYAGANPSGGIATLGTAPPPSVAPTTAPLIQPWQMTGARAPTMPAAASSSGMRFGLAA